MSVWTTATSGLESNLDSNKASSCQQIPNNNSAAKNSQQHALINKNQSFTHLYTAALNSDNNNKGNFYGRSISHSASNITTAASSASSGPNTTPFAHWQTLQQHQQQQQTTTALQSQLSATIVAAAAAAAASVATGQTPSSNNNNINNSTGSINPNQRFSITQFPPPPPPPPLNPRPRRNNSSNMSQSGEDLHSPSYLSWRKLQLSRAKLKASSKTSALLSGFAMVAMVEVQLNNDTQVPSGMLIAFAICTTLLVAVHMLALMISTCILPNIETVCNLHSISLVHESPHERLHWYIETAWAFSTLLGLILFLLEIAILCWVKFYDLSKPAAWSACIVLIPVIIIFLAFAIHFYRSIITHKYEVQKSGLQELEMLKEQMEHDHLDPLNHHRNNGLQFGGNSEIV